MNNNLKHKETLTLTKAATNKLRVAQRAMERSMLGICFRDKKKQTSGFDNKQESLMS